MATATAPRLDVQVAEARKLAGVGLAAAVGLAKGRWIVAAIALGIVGVAIALLIRESDEVRLKLALAPIDDEPLTSEDSAALDAARSEQDVPWEEAKKELATVAGQKTT